MSEYLYKLVGTHVQFCVKFHHVLTVKYWKQFSTVQGLHWTNRFQISYRSLFLSYSQKFAVCDCQSMINTCVNLEVSHFENPRKTQTIFFVSNNFFLRRAAALKSTKVTGSIKLQWRKNPECETEHPAIFVVKHDGYRVRHALICGICRIQGKAIKLNKSCCETGRSVVLQVW